MGGTLTGDWGTVPMRLDLGENVSLVIDDANSSSGALMSPLRSLPADFRIISRSLTPPQISYTSGRQSDTPKIFDQDEFYAKAPLFVPAQSVDLYRNDAEWGRFTTIKAISDSTYAGKEFTVYVDGSTSIKGGHIFRVNDNDSGVAWIGTEKGSYPYNEYPDIDLSKPVRDNDGNYYTVTTIGDGINKVICRSCHIHPNITRINDNATPGNIVYFDNETSIQYLGKNSISTYMLSGNVRLADGATLKSDWGGLGKVLDLGRNINLIADSEYMYSQTGTYGVMGTDSIVSRSVTPPQIKYVGKVEGTKVAFFKDERCYSYPLLVPAESIEAYKADPEWGKFSDIRSITDPGNGSSAIEDIEDATPDTATEWYTLQGQRLTNRPTAPGIYIELRGKSSRKIAIQGMR